MSGWLLLGQNYCIAVLEVRQFLRLSTTSLYTGFGVMERQVIMLCLGWNAANKASFEDRTRLRYLFVAQR